ncbi:hypothetical protein [Crateriforma spongiae]|uniref:hypothetical protein n=1 Tax=Crateriforma spongiae TaxID=2724528 RepID=UPI001446A7E6|nr:hypothetical protein [Crateriforma spongiae]
MNTNHAKIAFQHFIKTALASDDAAKAFLPATSDDDSIWVELANELSQIVDCVMLPPGEMFLEALLSAIQNCGPSTCIVFPPWQSRRELSEELRQQHPQFDFAKIVAQEVAAVMPANGRLTLCVPAGMVTSESGRRFREAFFEKHLPTRIVTLNNSDQLIDRVHPSFQFCLVSVKTKAAAREPLKLFKPTAITNDKQLDAVLQDFDRLNVTGGGATEFGYVIRDGLPAASPIIHDYFEPRFLQEQRSLEAIGELKRIDELFDFVPVIHTTHAREGLHTERADGRFWVIDGRAVQRDGTIDHGEVRHWVDQAGERELRVGDLCFRSIGRFSDGEVVFAEVQEKDLPAVASQSTVVLRPKENLDHLDLEVLVAMMKSQQFADAVAARCGNSLHLLRAPFGEMQVPVPDESLKIAVHDLNEAISKFDHFKTQATRARSVLFSFSSPTEMRTEILASGRLSRLRRAACEAIDSVSYRIRSLYPHPVAIRWRSAEVSRRDLEGYVELLETAEVLAYYLASMAMVQADAIEGAVISHVGEISKRLGRGGEKSVGTSMGDWLAIIREVSASKAWSRFLADAPFPEVLTFIMDDPEVDKAMQRISEARNDQAHGRGPKGAAVAEKFDEVFADVEYFFTATEFLSEYPIRFIEKTNRDSMRKLTRYQYRDLIGDHPLTPQQEAESDDAELEAGSLYFVARDDSLLRVRPYITRRECPECGCMSLMYLDRFNAKTGECILKGLDHAHTAKDSTVTDDFRFVGFLPSQS